MTATVAGAGFSVEMVDRGGTSFNMHLLFRCRIRILEAGGRRQTGASDSRRAHGDTGGSLGGHEIIHRCIGRLRLWIASCS